MFQRVRSKWDITLLLLLGVALVKLIWVVKSTLPYSSKCYFYMNTHFLDSNALRIASKTWLDNLYVQVGVFKIKMISLPNHNVEKLFPIVLSNCSSKTKFNGKLNLPCIDTEIYYHFLSEKPKVNWLYISDVMNHVNFQNLNHYITNLESFLNPKIHIVFKSHVANGKISDHTGWLVSRAFAKYVVKNNISFQNIAEMSTKDGFAETAHSILVSKLFHSVDNYDEPFMTDFICGNCDLKPEKCPKGKDLYRTSDLITTGFQTYPKTAYNYLRQINYYPNHILFFKNEKKKRFFLCENVYGYNYQTLNLERIKEKTPIISGKKVANPIIEQNYTNTNKYIPKYESLIQSEYQIKNFNPSSATIATFFIFVKSTKNLTNLLNLTERYITNSFLKDHIIEFVAILPNDAENMDLQIPYVITPCNPNSDNPEGLSCCVDFSWRVFSDYFGHSKWYFKISDDTLINFINIFTYFSVIEAFVNPYKNIVAKMLDTKNEHWLMSNRLIHYLTENKVSLTEFSRFSVSKRKKENNAISHIMWSLFNSSIYYKEIFNADKKCAECQVIHKYKNSWGLHICPINQKLIKAADLLTFNSMDFDEYYVYTNDNIGSFDRNIGIYSIPSESVFHLCILPHNEDKNEMLTSLKKFNFKEVTPVFETAADSSKILRPDDYKNYYFIDDAI